MKRDKILEEFLETNPDMDREQLEKIVTILMKNNPEIKIDKNFKEKLKNKLELSTDYQKKSFLRFFFFLAPVVWAICIFTFFFIFSNIWQNHKLTENTEFLMKSDPEKFQSTLEKDNTTVWGSPIPASTSSKTELEDKSIYKMMDKINNFDFQDACEGEWYDFENYSWKKYCKFKGKVCDEKQFHEGNCELFK